jgi:hypothetical protein
MAGVSSEKRSATLKIPGEYLHHVRAALIEQAVQESEDLRSAHDVLVMLNDVGDGTRPTDHAKILRGLRQNVLLLDQLFGAEGDTIVSGTGEDLAHTLGVLSRLRIERLAVGCVPADEPAAVLRRLEEIQWAAGEAIRLDPRLDDRFDDDAEGHRHWPTGPVTAPIGGSSPPAGEPRVESGGCGRRLRGRSEPS